MKILKYYRAQFITKIFLVIINIIEIVLYHNLLLNELNHNSLPNKILHTVKTLVIHGIID